MCVCRRRALQAMREALKYVQRSRLPDKDLRQGSLEQRIGMTERFAEAKAMMDGNPAGAVAACNALLDEAPTEMDTSEASIRIGDVYALLVEYWHAQRNMEQAYALIEKMRGQRIILSPYLDNQMVAEVYRAMGIAANPAQAEHDDGGIDEDEIPMDEEVLDDEY